MLFQELAPLELDEHTALLLRDAVKREQSRLRALAVSARDRADREAWALYDLQWFTLSTVARRLNESLRGGGAPTEDFMRELSARVRRKRRRMPRSKANAALAAARGGVESACGVTGPHAPLSAAS